MPKDDYFAGRDNDEDGSVDSNYNCFHPGIDSRYDGRSPPSGPVGRAIEARAPLFGPVAVGILPAGTHTEGSADGPKGVHLIGSIICLVWEGRAMRAGLCGNSGPVLLGSVGKLGSDSFDPSPGLAARRDETILNGMGADTDTMLLEQALPPLSSGSGSMRDNACCDDFPPTGGAGGGDPGFLGSLLCEDASLFAGSKCGRTLDRDGPFFLLQPSLDAVELDQPPFWDPLCEPPSGWAAAGQECRLGLERESPARPVSVPDSVVPHGPW